MNKIKLFVLAAVLTSFAAGVHAGVTFLPAMAESIGSSGGGSHSSSADKCRNEGYVYTSCESGEVLADACPYNGTYYKTCCPEGYDFTKEECLNAGLSYSRKSCGGKYRCL